MRFGPYEEWHDPADADPPAWAGCLVLGWCAAFWLAAFAGVRWLLLSV
jgi:hypothetical protein